MNENATRLLQSIAQDQSGAAEELLPLVYQELRRLAASKMATERPGHTLQATALVHEAYLRLIGDSGKQWDHRGHFFRAASEAMRRILVENARRKLSAKRGGKFVKVDIAEIDIEGPNPDEKLLMIHEVLDQLASEDPVKAEVVKLHFFTGFTFDEVAQALGISEKTARRYWTYAKVWLFKRIEKSEAGSLPGGLD